MRSPPWAIDWRYNDSTQGVPLSDADTGFLACGKFKYTPGPEIAISPLLTVKGRIVDSIAAISPLQTLTLSDNLSTLLEKLTRNKREKRPGREEIYVTRRGCGLEYPNRAKMSFRELAQP
jgi:hypothetical protein